MLMNRLHCCAAFDLKEWPDKITKTEAKVTYGLKDHHLLPQECFSPTTVRLLTNHPGGLPKPRYGTYMVSGVTTTMFLREEVIELAELLKGDLQNYLEKRKAEREERSRKIKEGKAKKREKEALAVPIPQTRDQIMFQQCLTSAQNGTIDQETCAILSSANIIDELMAEYQVPMYTTTPVIQKRYEKTAREEEMDMDRMEFEAEHSWNSPTNQDRAVPDYDRIDTCHHLRSGDYRYEVFEGWELFNAYE